MFYVCAKTNFCVGLYVILKYTVGFGFHSSVKKHRGSIFLFLYVCVTEKESGIFFQQEKVSERGEQPKNPYTGKTNLTKFPKSNTRT